MHYISTIYTNSVVFINVGLLINGDFETAPSGGFNDDSVGDRLNALPSWKLDGTVELVASGQQQGGMILIVPEGRHAVRLGNDAQISQDVKLEKGEIYSITFSASRTCAQLESLNVSVPPATQTIDLQTLYSVQGWDTYAWAFQADKEDAQVVFTNPGMEDDPTCGPIIDDIAIKKLFVPTKTKGSISSKKSWCQLICVLMTQLGSSFTRFKIKKK